MKSLDRGDALDYSLAPLQTAAEEGLPALRNSA